MRRRTQFLVVCALGLGSSACVVPEGGDERAFCETADDIDREFSSGPAASPQEAETAFEDLARVAPREIEEEVEILADVADGRSGASDRDVRISLERFGEYVEERCGIRPGF